MVDLVNKLEKYYRIITPKDLLGKYVLRSFKGAEAQNSKGDIDPLLLAVNNALVHTGDGTSSGLLSIKEIVQTIKDATSKQNDQELSKFVKIYHDSASSLPGASGDSGYYRDLHSSNKLTMSSILKIDTSNEIAQKFSVIMTATPMISMPVRDVNKITLFMNSIPTVEMSRCIPYLNVKLQFRRSDEDNYLRAPSLLKFLNGGIELTAKSADKSMFDAMKDTESVPGGQQRTISTAGMELFTSPQTLYNLSSAENETARRYTPVLDVFRPFLSIDSFEVSALPSVGMFSYKTAKLNLVLHDRSRLSEISDFVRPEVYTNTTLSISYGWKHPDGINSENAYGDLINQMIVSEEKYGIVNASFSFDNAQQVRITLQLAMKGTQELRVTKISENSEYADAAREIQKISEEVSRLREKAGLKKPEFVNKEIRAYQILDAVSNGEVLTGINKDEVKQLVNSLRNNPNNQAKIDLANYLDKIFKSDKNTKNTGFIEVQNNTIKSFINEKFEKISTGPDPFLDKSAYGDEIKNFENEARTKDDLVYKNRYVSLAKLLLVFCVEPFLGAHSDSYDEVQMIFYQFNSQAGKARNTSIGSFPIEISYLREIVDDHIYNKRNVDMTINEFVLLVQTSIINDPRAIAYGLRSFYSKRKKLAEPPEMILSGKKGIKNPEDVFSSVMGKEGGTFKFPTIEASVETRGGRVLKNGERGQEKAQSNIMRIHIYDKQSSPYDQVMQVFKTQTGLQELIDDTGKQPIPQNIKDMIEQLGFVFSYNEKTNATTIKSTSSFEIKKKAAAALPTITYGTSASAIISANLQSQQNQLLSTVQALRTAGRQNNTEPNGSSHGGIPLRIIPCQLDMETFGCALLNLNQQYFIDFQTGTTADNIYLLTGLEHKIKQGSFVSHLKLTPLDAYGALEDIVKKVEQISEILKKDTTTKD